MGDRKHINQKDHAEGGRLKAANSPSPMAHGPQRAESALIIFGKAPIPGQVKTRLCPPLTHDEAATLQGSLVLDVVERARCEARGAGREAKSRTLNLGPRTSNLFDRFLACSPSREHVFFKILQERQGLRLMDQVGEDLGQRMDQAFREVLALGYQRVLLVGTDVPTLPASSYSQALALLADHDLVLGPSLDGGYYLIGLKRPAPALFTDIPWSTDQVFALTRKKAEALGLKSALLPVCRDLDTVDDLLALIDETGLGARGSRLEAKSRSKEAHPAPAPRPSPLTSSLSARTAGVIQMLADRLKSRPLTHPSPL